MGALLADIPEAKPVLDEWGEAFTPIRTAAQAGDTRQAVVYLTPTDNSSVIIRYNPPISHGQEGDSAMASNPLFYQLLLVALVLICLMVHVGLPDDIPRVTKTPLAPKPPVADVPQNLSRLPGSSTNRSVRPVSKRPLAARRRQGRRRLSSPSHEDVGAQSIRKPTSVPIPLARTTAGLDSATCAPMGTPADSPGASCNVSHATGISLRHIARFFMANAHLLSASCTSSPVWLKG